MNVLCAVSRMMLPGSPLVRSAVNLPGPETTPLRVRVLPKNSVNDPPAAVRVIDPVAVEAVPLTSSVPPSSVSALATSTPTSCSVPPAPTRIPTSGDPNACAAPLVTPACRMVSVPVKSLSLLVNSSPLPPRGRAATVIAPPPVTLPLSRTPPSDEGPATVTALVMSGS